MDSNETLKLIERTNRFYEEYLRARLEAFHRNEFVVIEPETGDYFLGRTMSEAATAARATHPGRDLCIMRVGHEAATHFGIFKLFPPIGVVLRPEGGRGARHTTP